jgi:hypothetical protein
MLSKTKYVQDLAPKPKTHFELPTQEVQYADAGGLGLDD